MRSHVVDDRCQRRQLGVELRDRAWAGVGVDVEQVLHVPRHHPARRHRPPRSRSTNAASHALHHTIDGVSLTRSQRKTVTSDDQTCGLHGRAGPVSLWFWLGSDGDQNARISSSRSAHPVPTVEHLRSPKTLLLGVRRLGFRTTASPPTASSGSIRRLVEPMRTSGRAIQQRPACISASAFTVFRGVRWGSWTLIQWPLSACRPFRPRRSGPGPGLDAGLLERDADRVVVVAGDQGDLRDGEPDVVVQVRDHV